MFRTLTIEEGLRLLKWGKKSRYSLIRVKGKWLTSAGFKPGQKVRVEVEQGRLIITAA